MKCLKFLYIIKVLTLVNSYDQNTFIKMSQMIKEAVYPELSKPCWVCTKVPPDSERGLAFTPWPLSEANFSAEAPKNYEILKKHPRRERELLHVTTKIGKWCYERTFFFSKFGMEAKNVGTSTCTKYFNGTKFTKQRNIRTSNIIKEPTELEQELDPTVPRELIYWICGTVAYRFLPQNWVGSCYPTWILPLTTVLFQLPQGRIRN